MLLRDRLDETLSTVRRSELHWKAGLIADAHGSDPSTVANHLLEGNLSYSVPESGAHNNATA